MLFVWGGKWSGICGKVRQRANAEHRPVQIILKVWRKNYRSSLILTRDIDALETQSTNCGNNITYLLELLEREKIPCRSIILCQDATMQRRMEMGLRKYRPQGMEIINYAAYQAEVVAQGSQLTYREAIPGMWTVDRYVNLLMGEIPRLTDNDAGYGPNGKNYIAHDDIPPEVQAAFERLQAVYGTQTRAANPLYASK